MKFTILSHAGMLVEGGGKSVLFDPWVVGSTYWRSWWNFPEIEREFLDDIKPDYIYLTHLHWDHFHSPSLRIFDKDVKYLVPEIPGTRMVRDLKSIKRTNIEEIPHGEKVELWDGCFLHSYQFGLFAADSAAVISDGETTLFNANDAKTFGYSLKQITKQFPKIDFVFRSHSSATPFPYCVKGYEEEFADFRTQEDYIEEFASFSAAVGAEYAIPFASNHCFLHKETRKFNSTGVDPQMVADNMNSKREAGEPMPRCVVMVPGSSWSSDEGFVLRDFDYADKAKIVEQMAQKYEPKLEAQYEKEANYKSDFKAFRRYFDKFLDATPLVIRKTVLPKVLFKTTDVEGEKFYLLDIPGKQVLELKNEIDDVDAKITVPTIVLMACCRQKMFSVWSASKRLEIELVDGRLSKVQALIGFLDFFENEGLPLRNNFSRRDFPIWLRRWREGAEAVRLFLRHKILRKEFVISELYR